MQLNTWAYIILGLQGLTILLIPFVIGKDKGEYNWGSWIGSVLGFVLMLLALGLRINFSF